MKKLLFQTVIMVLVYYQFHAQDTNGEIMKDFLKGITAIESKKDHINNIIGKPDQQVRTMYLFN